MSDEQPAERKVVMVKKTLVNTDAYTRTFLFIQNEDGSTLELDPGESAEVMVPKDFDDPVLQEAKVGASSKKSKQTEAGSGQSDTQKS